VVHRARSAPGWHAELIGRKWPAPTICLDDACEALGEPLAQNSARLLQLMMEKPGECHGALPIDIKQPVGDYNGYRVYWLSSAGRR
jgi:hypothetical protein